MQDAQTLLSLYTLILDPRTWQDSRAPWYSLHYQLHCNTGFYFCL